LEGMKSNVLGGGKETVEHRTEMQKKKPREDQRAYEDEKKGTLREMGEPGEW